MSAQTPDKDGEPMGLLSTASLDSLAGESIKEEPAAVTREPQTPSPSSLKRLLSANSESEDLVSDTDSEWDNVGYESEATEPEMPEHKVATTPFVTGGYTIHGIYKSLNDHWDIARDGPDTRVRKVCRKGKKKEPVQNDDDDDYEIDDEEVKAAKPATGVHLTHSRLKQRNKNAKYEQSLLPQFKHPNGRVVGRKLVHWHFPRMIEKLLLHLQYECWLKGIQLPWKETMHRMAPFATPGASLQYLKKMRDILITEGHMVPPPILRNHRRAHADESVRGHIRDMEGQFPTSVREVFFDEEPEDRRTSLENPDIIRGSGNYARRSDGTYGPKPKKGSTASEKGSPMPIRKRKTNSSTKPTTDEKSSRPTRKRKPVFYAEVTSDPADLAELDLDADFSPPARPTKRGRKAKETGRRDTITSSSSSSETNSQLIVKLKVGSSALKENIVVGEHKYSQVGGFQAGSISDADAEYEEEHIQGSAVHELANPVIMRIHQGPMYFETASQYQQANLNYELPAPPHWPESGRDAVRTLRFPSGFGQRDENDDPFYAPSTATDSGRIRFDAGANIQHDTSDGFHAADIGNGSSYDHDAVPLGAETFYHSFGHPDLGAMHPGFNSPQEIRWTPINANWTDFHVGAHASPRPARALSSPRTASGSSSNLGGSRESLVLSRNNSVRINDSGFFESSFDIPVDDSAGAAFDTTPIFPPHLRHLYVAPAFDPEENKENESPNNFAFYPTTEE